MTTLVSWRRTLVFSTLAPMTTSSWCWVSIVAVGPLPLPQAQDQHSSKTSKSQQFLSSLNAPPSCPSLGCREEFPESDYCHALRKAQRSKWSMDTWDSFSSFVILSLIVFHFIHSVAIGVKHFKVGENSKAMKYFDHALEIDDSNVEGLVARGAL